MTLLAHTKRWIENSWREVGASFNANRVPVVQFENLNVDNLSYAFKNEGVVSWFLNEGTLELDGEAKIARVPYIAFSINEAQQRLHIQVQWAGRCGYGYEILFSESGEVVNQKMCWIS